MIASPLAPKWPILIPFCGLDHQKSKFLLVSCNFDVRGCWGQPILLFWKNIDKTQMSLSPECAATFFWTWKSTLVGHLGLQSMAYRVGTPCRPKPKFFINRLRLRPPNLLDKIFGLSLSFFWKNLVDFWHQKLTFKVWFCHFLMKRSLLTD